MRNKKKLNLKKIKIKYKSYQVDQSGKIEQTNKVTIIAFSNTKNGSIKLLAKDKRYLQKIYRQAGKSKIYIFQVFSALLYLLLEKSKIGRAIIVIDKEYPGQEALIKSYLTQLVQKRGRIKLNFDELRFDFIGKGSNAHGVASRAYKINRANYIASKEEILSLILLYEK
ncbi:MAG: hypothetical protein A2W22_03545 [Candidatus Levybacteria bacterium RBG_16_35_11]|nr:MAG: hypothetical protein A2W22_03545 [Candidatus Levybacteria bacterium RBG_16_35_11]